MNSELLDIAKKKTPQCSTQKERYPIICLNEAAGIGVEAMGKICLVYRQANWK